MDIFSLIEIIKETADFVVINKPSGLIVHPNAHRQDSTLVDWLLDKFPNLKNVGEDKLRPGIVHRLDQDVSGLMVIARTNKMFFYLKKQWQDKKVKKRYKALIFGQPVKDQDKINLPIGRSSTEPGKFKIKHDQSGKPSITVYQVIEKFKKYSLVDIDLKTGRTHQIRVHFKGIGHSIVGDKLYKSKGVRSNLDRIFLHAYYLGFFDFNHKWQEFKIDLPVLLKKRLESLDIL